MRITMVKKQLASGEPCRKCAQAEELLKNRGLWERIDRVAWAIEGDPSSEGMRLGVEHGVDIAPFFIVEDGSGAPAVYRSALKFIKERLADRTTTPRSGGLDRDAVAKAARDLADSPPHEILRWGLEHFGADCAIAFSGAEDVVLIDMAVDLGLPFSSFTLDTGRLHPETYRFIDTVRKRYGIEIEVMSPNAERLQAFVKDKGLFSFYEDGHHECCGIRKVEPLKRALSGRRAWATGQRRDQSPATRDAVPVVQLDPSHRGVEGDLVKLNPLAAWSSNRVWRHIREHDVPYNPLHERGFISIGCEPCTRAVLPGEHERAGRWWWEDATKRECGLHVAHSDDE